MWLTCSTCKVTLSKDNYKPCANNGHELYLFMDECDTCGKCIFDCFYQEPPKENIKIMKEANKAFRKVEEHNFEMCLDCAESKNIGEAA